MNNFLKISTLCFLFIVSGSQATFAQFGIGLGIQGGIPTGDFDLFADLGAGLYIEPKYIISNKISVGLNSGLMGFSAGDLSNFLEEAVDFYTMIPVTAFGKYIFLDRKFSPYLGASAGAYLIKGTNFDYQDQGLGFVDGQSRTEFGFAPRFGFVNGKFDFELSYHIIDVGSFFSYRLGFDIGARRDY